MVIRISALLAMAALLACGPTLLLPGGELEGTPAPPPSDWNGLSEVSTIQLESRPNDPYSVNIWAVGIDDKLYVHAGANRAAWVEHMDEDPAVRVRVGETMYDLTAVRVEAQDEFDAFANAYEVKYGSRPRNESVGEAYLFYLVAR